MPAVDKDLNDNVLNECGKLNQRLADHLRHWDGPECSSVPPQHDADMPIPETTCDRHFTFEPFEAFPPEIMLIVIRFTALSKDWKDLKAMILSSRDAQSLWKTSSLPILRFAASCLPDHGEFMLYCCPNHTFFTNVDCNGNKVLIQVKREKIAVK